MKVISTSPTPIARVKEILEERAEAGEELGYEQANALEHAKEFSRMDTKKALSFASKLRKAVPSLSEESAVKIADIMPASAALVKAIMLQSKLELKDEEIETILSAVRG